MKQYVVIYYRHSLEFAHIDAVRHVFIIGARNSTQAKRRAFSMEALPPECMAAATALKAPEQMAEPSRRHDWQII